MRIGICARDDRERTTLVKWIGQYCALYGRVCEITAEAEGESLLGLSGREVPELVFVGLGGQEGLRLARQLRALCHRCAIVLIDDTAEHAVQGVRLHAADYMVRPLDFKKLVRAMKLALAEKGL